MTLNEGEKYMQILSRVSDVKGIKSFKWFAYDHIHNEVYPGWISNGDTIVMRIIKDKTKELRDYLTKGRDIQDIFPKYSHRVGFNIAVNRLLEMIEDSCDGDIQYIRHMNKSLYFVNVKTKKETEFFIRIHSDGFTALNEHSRTFSFKTFTEKDVVWLRTVFYAY
jgi:hypothetical protein